MQLNNNPKISVIGAGSWGTALASLLAGKGYDVSLWAFEKDLVSNLKKNYENNFYLPGVELPKNLEFTDSLEQAILNKDIIVSVIPSQHVGKITESYAPYVSPDSLIVSASKGIETTTLLRMSEVLNKILPRNDIAVISGPSFALETVKKMPAAVVLAHKNDERAKYLQDIFHTDYFRVYRTDDIAGAEFGGSLKNIIAIAVGISDGLGFGYNARAALITRGIAEISRFSIVYGAQEKTFSGLSGIGDLLLTATGDLSRNRTVGIKLGKGEFLADILANMKMVAEGVETTKAAFYMAKGKNIDMPITSNVYSILYKNMDPRTAVIRLMGRDKKRE